MSLEDFAARRIDERRAQERRARPRENPRDQLFAQAHEKAQRILTSAEYAIQAPSFIDLYGQENVVIDMLKVKQKRILFEKDETPESIEAKKVADVFEAIMLQHTELSNWFGSNVSVLKTSLYDDYFNGTDMIAEWIDEERGSNVLALGVDVTFGKASIERKLQHIRRDVDKGNLGTIKYFKTADDTIRGERRGTPHVVVGVDKTSVEQLAQLWLRNDVKALAAHPVQRLLIEELSAQLTAIAAYAATRGQHKVADAYRRSLAIVERVRQEKSSVELGEFAKDRVYQEILERNKTIFKP